MRPRRAVLVVLLVGAAAGAWACRGDGPIFHSELAASVTVDAGNAQTGVTGVPLPEYLSVRVLRPDGVPLPGVTVTWETVSGSVLPFQKGRTDAAGIAEATWVLGATSGPVRVRASVASWPPSATEFTASAVSPPTLVVDSASNSQAGEVGAALPLPLRVHVRSGGSTAGLVVFWKPSDGAANPETSTVDAGGWAATNWTLGRSPGRVTMLALLPGAVNPEAGTFSATANAGPASAIMKSSGDLQSTSMNRPFPQPLTAVVRDRHGNGIAGVPISWTVESGPVALGAADTRTAADGSARLTVAPAGGLGTAIVRASVTGTGLTVDFSLTVALATFAVTLNTSRWAFESSQNNSSPAVDTIPLGATVTWRLDPFDYDLHGVGPVGTPSFTAGDFPYASPSVVMITFPVAGTYRYEDPFYPEIRGTLVVR